MLISRSQNSRQNISRCRGNTQRGGAYLEGLIAIPVFLVLVIAGMQFMWVAWRHLSAQFIATQTMREIALGHCTISTSCASVANRINWATTYAIDRGQAFGLGWTTSNVTVCIKNFGATACKSPTNSADRIDPGDRLVLEITHINPMLIQTIKMKLVGGGTTSTGFHTDPNLVGQAVGIVEQF